MKPDSITDGIMVPMVAINMAMRCVSAMVEIKRPNARELNR